jgi:cyanophycinase
MGRAPIRLFLAATLVLLVSLGLSPARAGNKKGPSGSGTLILGGGFSDTEQTDVRMQRRIAHAGSKPNVVIIPTADARLEPAARAGASLNPIDYENDVRPDFISLGAGRVRALHTRNRFLADTADFADPLRFAGLVWIPGDDAQLLFNVYPKTRVERELKAVLDRGGVVAADAAGAILLGQMRFSVSADHPEHPASAPEPALGLLPGVFVLPHANRYQPGVLETSGQAQVGARPELLGLLIDENTAVIIRDDQIVGIVGKGRVGIVEGATSVRWLAAHERYDLRKRAVIAAPVATDAAKAQ